MRVFPPHCSLIALSGRKLLEKFIKIEGLEVGYLYNFNEFHA
jgi:hypothetical protein